ncbi:hypothetical protein CPL00134L_CDS0057 [Escherichia phage Phagiculus]
MKIVDREMFEIAQVYARDAVKSKSERSWMCAREYLKMAYGL